MTECNRYRFLLSPDGKYVAQLAGRWTTFPPYAVFDVQDPSPDRRFVHIKNIGPASQIDTALWHPSQPWLLSAVSVTGYGDPNPNRIRALVTFNVAKGRVVSQLHLGEVKIWKLASWSGDGKLVQVPVLPRPGLIPGLPVQFARRT